MKSIVRVFVAPELDKPGSSHQYIVDDSHAGHGKLVAEAITAAVDTRPDVAGRLAELRRYVVMLSKQRPRTSLKPKGGQLPGARVQYFATSRLTGKQVRVELRHYDRPTGVAPNADEPADG